MKQKYVVYALLVLLIGFSFSACLNKNDEAYEQYQEELAAHQKKVYEQFLVDSSLITDYLAVNDSIAEFDSIYGLFYHILQAGTEYHPNIYSVVTVQYKGMLLDGTVFDKTEGDTIVQYTLGNFISGWQVGLQKIGSGGKIILYLPSVYGYGENKVGTIPENSVLIFDVDLLSFY